METNSPAAILTTYSINATDSESPAAWMRGPHIVSCTPGAQDSGMCAYTVVTTEAERLSADLDADLDVDSYDDLTEDDLTEVTAELDGTTDVARGERFAVVISVGAQRITGSAILVDRQTWGDDIRCWASDEIASAILSRPRADRKDLIGAVTEACASLRGIEISADEIPDDFAMETV